MRSHRVLITNLCYLHALQALQALNSVGGGCIRV